MSVIPWLASLWMPIFLVHAQSVGATPRCLDRRVQCPRLCVGDEVSLYQRSLVSPAPAPAQVPFFRDLSDFQIKSCFNEHCDNWLDDEGNVIEAHGAGFLQSPRDDKWYWFGETRKTHVNESDHGVNCYSAYTLGGPWHFEGQVLSQSDIQVEGKEGPWVVERPKVIYNNKTKLFVMWFHLDLEDPNCCDWGPLYTFRHVAVATAKEPWGPFNFQRAFMPDGVPSLDMSLWMDPKDKVAYFIRSCNNSYMGISRLTEDYLNTTGMISKGPLAEGMALFRHTNGTLFMMTSHLTGWKPNPLMLWRSDGPSLEDPQWVDTGNPTGDPVSFNTQPTFVVQYTTVANETYFIYMADNWIHAGPGGLLDASYAWLPIRFDKHNTSMKYMETWDLQFPFALYSEGSALAPGLVLCVTVLLLPCLF